MRIRCLSGALRTAAGAIAELSLDSLQSQIDQIGRRRSPRLAGEHEACRRLMAIPGVGSADGDGGRRRHRERSWSSVRAELSQHGWAWFRGNIRPAARRSCSESASGATAICEDSSCREHAPCCSAGTSRHPVLVPGWPSSSARAHHNVVAVALANKMARIAWAVLTKGEAYRPPALVVNIWSLSWPAIDAW